MPSNSRVTIEAAKQRLAVAKKWEESALTQLQMARDEKREAESILKEAEKEFEVDSKDEPGKRSGLKGGETQAVVTWASTPFLAPAAPAPAAGTKPSTLGTCEIIRELMRNAGPEERRDILEGLRHVAAAQKHQAIYNIHRRGGQLCQDLGQLIERHNAHCLNLLQQR